MYKLSNNTKYNESYCKEKKIDKFLSVKKYCHLLKTIVSLEETNLC